MYDEFMYKEPKPKIAQSELKKKRDEYQKKIRQEIKDRIKQSRRT